MNYIEFREKWRGQRVDFDKFYRFQCFPKKHFVLMEGGFYKDIKDISVGDRVYNFNGTKINTVINTMSNNSIVEELNCGSMGKIKTTNEHPFYCKKLISGRNDRRYQKYAVEGRVNAGSLSAYDLLLSPTFNIPEPINLTKDELFFYGYWLGNGSKTQGVIRVCSSNKNKKFEIISNLKVNLSTYEYKNQKGTFDHVIVNSKHEQLVKIINDSGHKCNKQLLLIFNNEQYKVILDGYLAADGSLYSGKKFSYRAQTISKKLQLSICYAAVKCGYFVGTSVTYKNIQQTIEGRNVTCFPEAYHMSISKEGGIHSHKNKTYNSLERFTIKGKTGVSEKTLVYNISTDGDMTYTINNIGVHNCVDLIRQYALEVHKIALPGSGGSAKLRRLSDWGKHKKIANTPEGAPQQGDIIFFDATPRNSFGHVGIVESADIKTVLVLDQNGGIGKGNGIAGDEIQLRKFNYIRPRCLGRIRLTSKK